MNDPIVISETNLSHAWAKALLCTARQSLNNPPPLCVTITGFEKQEPIEDLKIREALDSELTERPRTNLTDVSAMVVFPYRAWVSHGRPPCSEFSRWCLDKFVPRLKARDRRNKRGLYFERMMCFSYRDFKGTLHRHNQLQYIIDWWKETGRSGRRPRRSGLQVTCFDPRKDHNKAPRLVFPCLQQVGFAYGNENGLILNALYPTQFIFDRAYGNYLGLCHLGAFMARQMGIQLGRVNCFVGCAQLGGNVRKRDIRPLLDFLESMVGLQEA